MIKKVVATAAAAGGLLLAGAGMAAADSGAMGAAVGSPGVVSGNVVQAPIHIPANVCGNTVNVVGVLNPAVGNTCVNA
ncbi:chaplin [Streptomyces sp. N2-109]|uniref:Chaplin n=1 Tax=Streptomyces gossypii TaxID=2883101 RepID=A0ABT2JLJ0_9ACTN|nr:chaplin [Streptomyces gossypii]MCT2588741.1 chaplin [Streptomyces gossypii]